LKKVIAINALGVAPTGATPEFFRSRGMDYPPEHGPLAAVTPGTPGGIMVMLAEYGRLSLADVLAPAIEMADGFAIEAQLADGFEREKAKLKEWPNSARILLPHRNAKGEGREAPRAGEIFVQAELAARYANWWKRRSARSREAPRASKRSWRPTIGFTEATSRPSLPLPCKPRAV